MDGTTLDRDADALPPRIAALIGPWAGPYGGVPPFDRIEVAVIEPAYEAAMALKLAEIDAIVADPAPPTFENTIVALERSGRALGRIGALYGVFASNLKTPAVQAVEARLSPRLSAFDDAITQNAPLFARIDAVYRAPEQATLTVEQRRLTWRHWLGFSRHGALLAPPEQARLTILNQQLAELQTRFDQNELADEERLALVIEDAAGLAGLAPALIEGYAADAAAHGLPGQWRVAATRSAVEPFLVQADDRPLRERAFAMWTSRGDTGGETDNNAIVTRILALRAEKAQLLGYPTYADWHLADTMAKTPQAALDLSMKVWRPAVAQVARDVAAMQAIVDAEGGGFAIRPWDYRYYADRLRRARYDLDMGAVKAFLRLDRVRDAMLAMAGRLYGLAFTPAPEVPVFHPDVSVWAVSDRDGAPVGLWYFDAYARPGKSSGAWMTSYRVQSRFDGRVLPLVSNNSNFVKGTGDVPELIGLDEATTMFHEFGHGLHALLSDVTYPRMAGTSVARDFVEFPSQIHENWLTAPETLGLLVNEAGEPMPASLVARIAAARSFNKGFAVVETQASALLDMKMHLMGATPVDPKAFETRTLAELGMPPQIVMRHRIPHFGHVFAGDGYAAGYYGYLWAEVLERDAFAAFEEAGDLWDPAIASRLRDTVLAVGNTVDAGDAYRAFRGRDPDPEALLRHYGFETA